MNDHSISKKVYTIDDVASKLKVCSATALLFCLQSPDFSVKRLGQQVRVDKASFDNWLAADGVYTVNELRQMLACETRTMYNHVNADPPKFRILRIGRCIRIPATSFDSWLESTEQ